MPRSLQLTLKFVAIAWIVAAVALSAHADDANGPAVLIDLPASTQGPFWPPAEVTNADGDFLLVGQVMTEIAPGVAIPIPNQAVLVSKNTVPPLDANGVEDPNNWFGAGYDVIRPLDLSPGSPDLETELWALSFGGYETPSGAPRIPAEGDSPFNLNGDLFVCPDTAPASSQAGFMLPRRPLHQVRIPGFQGDDVAYDADTGDTFDPETATDCGLPRCPGEDAVDRRRTEPITLGEWLEAKGQVKIQLTGFSEEAGGYTQARFDFKLRDMLPNAIYTVWQVRFRQVPIPGVFERRDIDPLAIPNVIVTDDKGQGEASFVADNPFPAAATDFRGLRTIGLSVVFHSDYRVLGACFSETGPGVDVHVVFNTLIDGTALVDDDFITVPGS